MTDSTKDEREAADHFAGADKMVSDEAQDRAALLAQVIELRAQLAEKQGHLVVPSIQPHGSVNHGQQWIPVSEQSTPRDDGTYLVACATGQVAPYIRGVIHNNAGSPWDWNYGEAITHWMPLPAPPTSDAANHGSDERASDAGGSGT